MEKFQTSNGFIELIVGCMFAGKTDELIRHISVLRRGKKKVLVFKPVFDNRFAKSVVQSHSGARISDVLLVKTPEDVEHQLQSCQSRVDVLAFDEIQFLKPEFCNYFEKKANEGYQIICAGLDKGYNDEFFPTILCLLATADFVTKLTAVCAVCGNLSATKTQRIDQNQQPIGPKKVSNVIGGEDVYQARCRKCYKHFFE